ncbi:MAG TPA: alpha/beta hydrolase [Mucilaginibacter sp.]|jgi:acetyl esterase/lipase|nr:alpha/beta hydrolase [Mucilaginibacter sp.]
MIRRIAFIVCLLPFLASAQTVIPLWSNGAPGFEKLKDIPEQAKDYWVKSINNPSLTIFLPLKDKANGSAVIVCPGGGHRLLVFNAEGVEPAQYLNNLGVTVFVLKYRLARDTNSPYKLDDARADGERAMRLVRSRAAEWGIDPTRVGMMGFSAGGEVVDMVAFDKNKADPNAKDPIDHINAKPDFLIQIYPGPGFIPDEIPADAPPIFLLAANDDVCCSPSVIRLLEGYRKAKAPVEAHILERGDHGFNMGKRSKLKAVNTWPQRMADWLIDNNFFKMTGERSKIMH